MKKKLIFLITALMLLIEISPCSYAKTDTLTQLAIKKYKRGNYTGCLQDCQNIVKRQPSNALAYYYLAMAYTQAGKKQEALAAYNKVLSLKPNPKKNRLAQYSKTGIRCLETPEQCKIKQVSSTTGKVTESESDIDKFINSTPYGGLSDAVKKDYQQKHLNAIKNEINNGKDVDDYEFRKINKVQDSDKIAQADTTEQKKPTNDEVTAALKVLNEAGINPYSASANYQNPELSELNMLMGNNDQSRGDNSMLNMLPYMLAQNKGGESNNNYSPQVMQSLIMNSMMNTNFNLDLNNSEK